MLNRRHLRIKILQALYAFSQSNNDNLVAGEKELLHSINKIYDMYIYFLLIFEELPRFASQRIEEAKRKRIPTKEDLSPNMKFIENEFIKQIAENKPLHYASTDNKVNWMGDVEQDLLKKMFNYLRETELFATYMETKESSYEEDKNFVLQLFKKEICNFELLHNFLDEKSIYWQDDIDHVCSMVMKTLKSFTKESNEYSPILDLYKEDEEEFVRKLFRKTAFSEKENDVIISKYTKNWESDRLAKMDILLMNMAITEAKEFPSIPLKVTMNEYIEISKFYSTPKSDGFINGVIDKVFQDLKKEGVIKKIGRGLLE